MNEKQTIVPVEDHLIDNHRTPSFRHLSTHEFSFIRTMIIALSLFLIINSICLISVQQRLPQCRLQW